MGKNNKSTLKNAKSKSRISKKLTKKSEIAAKKLDKDVSKLKVKELKNIEVNSNANQDLVADKSWQLPSHSVPHLTAAEEVNEQKLVVLSNTPDADSKNTDTSSTANNANNNNQEPTDHPQTATASSPKFQDYGSSETTRLGQDLNVVSTTTPAPILSQIPEVVNVQHEFEPPALTISMVRTTLTQVVHPLIIGAENHQIPLTIDGLAQHQSVKEDTLVASASGKLQAHGSGATQLQWSVTDSQGQFGRLDIEPDTGEWHYRLDNSANNTDALAEGERQTEQFIITATNPNGEQVSTTVTVEVEGSNDLPHILGTHLASIGAAETLDTVVGQLNTVDPDHGDITTWAVIAGQGQYGQLIIDPQTGQWQYQLNNQSIATQALISGQQVTEMFTVTATDQSGHPVLQQVTIQVNGADNIAVIKGDLTGSVTEDNLPIDGLLTVSGQLSIQDPDANQAQFTAGSLQGQFGHLAIDSKGHWTYSADNSQAVIQSLKSGEHLTDTLMVYSIDGTEQKITVTINGTDDKPLIGGIASVSLAEDTNLYQGLLRADGTLTVINDDHGQNLFQATEQHGQFGSLTIDELGHWVYTADNSQFAIQGLKTGESVIDTLFVYTLDGTPQKISIIINGTDDKSLIMGTSVMRVFEDKHLYQGQLRADGQLIVTNPDMGRARFTASLIQGQFGILSINDNGHWTYTTDNNSSIIQGLKAGESLIETLIVQALDGTSQKVSILIKGADDQAMIGGTATASLNEDKDAHQGQLNVEGTLTVTDADAGQSQFIASLLHGQFGTLTINELGHWTYIADNSQAVIQSLKSGEYLTDTLMVHSIDGTEQKVTITINGTDDKAIIAGASTASLTEDVNVVADKLQAAGQLTLIDPDAGQDHFAAQTDLVSNLGLGHFSIDATGHWIYAADNTQTAIQQLKADESLTDTMTVTSVDGTTHTITVTLKGTNDSPVLTAQTQAVTEDGSQLNGKMSATDVDAGDTLTFSLAIAVDGFTLNADGSYSFDPSNVAYQHLAAGQIEDVVIPVTVTDHYGATSTQSLTITVTGANDSATIAGVSTGSATEDRRQAVTGQLTIADVDDGEAHFTAQQNTASAYGSLTLSEDGQWSYALNNSNTSVQALKAGESLTDTLTVESVDGTQHTITVTINGRDDGAVIGGVDTAAVSEDTHVNAGHLDTSGQLTITDADAGQAQFIAQTSAAGYGEFAIDTSGHWSYSADNTQSAVQQLKTGESLTDSLTVTSADGTTHTVTVTIQGTNDAPVLQAQTQAVTEGGAMLSGYMAATDVDAGDTQTFSLANAVDGFTLNADGSYSFDPSHVSYQHLAVGQTQDLIIPVAVTDSAGATNTQNLTITITGSNDGAVIGGVNIGAVTEDSTLTASGTLTISDADSAQAGFIAQTNLASIHGSFTLTASGDWTYVLDNSNAAVQALKTGESLTDTVNVNSIDGTQHTITVTINGRDDGAVIGGVDTATVTEDTNVAAGKIEANGQLTITDPDAGQAQFMAQTTTSGTYGEFVINANGAWNYHADNSCSEIQQLKASATLTDTFTVTSTDGTTHTITVTLTGSNDTPVIAAQTQSVIEDGTQLSGKMIATDVDAGDTQTFSIASSVDGFILNADGSYSFDPSHASYQHLAAGQTQDVVIPITVTDGAGGASTKNLTITVTGTNDTAVITTVDAGFVTEDRVVQGGTIQAFGTLGVTDADAGQAQFIAQSNREGANGLGHFTFNSDGHWTFSADNSQAAIQQLKAGDSLTDSLTASSVDGTTYTITVTIQGSNDTPVLAAQIQAVSEDGTQLSGHMVATDIDAGDTQTFSLASAVDGFTLNADGSYSFDPGHASYQHLAAGQTQDVVIPITVTDGAGATATQNLTIRLTGTNDAARISGTDIGRVVEDQTLSVSGKLDISDADDGQAHFIAQTATAGSYGNLTLGEDGHWQYQLDNSKPEVQALKSTDTGTDTFTVHSADGSSHSITVTIQGQRDSVVIGGVDVGVVKEDVSAVTGGHLVATGESVEFVPLQQRTTLGNFAMDASGAWIYTLDNSCAGAQVLKDGDTATDSVTITHTDGTTHTVTVTVMGTNDAPVLSAQTQAVTEDGTQLTGHMVATDVDAGDTKTFSTSTAVDGFTLNADGSYQFDLGHASYQHLAAGQTQNVIIPVTVTDSAGANSTQNLTITVTGANDGAVIGGVNVATVTEDAAVTTGHLQASGQLTISDVDSGEAHFTAQTDVAGSSGYGHFSVDTAGAWTYTADNTQTAIQQMKTGESLTDTLTVNSADGTTHTITVTLQGTNDVPVLAAQTQAVTEDGTLLSGHMVATDVDAGDTQTFSIAQPVDGFTLNADGSYSFDPSNPAYQYLAAGQKLDVIIPITVTDSVGATSTQNLTITATGANDGAVIGGVNVASVTEDTTVTTGQLQASGQLTISDIDTGEAHFSAQTDLAGSGGYGHFNLNTSGAWTYSAGNTQTAIQQLKAGESLIDTLSVTSVDGTTHTLTVTIEGTNDVPMLQAQSQAVTEDGTQLSGHMIATDVDAGDTQTFSLASAIDGFTLNADGSYSFDPGHASYQHLAAGQTQDLIIPITVTDGAGATATQNLTIRLTGTNDAARISGTDIGRVVEDQTLSVSGKLDISDADDGQAHFVAQNAAGSYGSLTLAEDGQWSYQLDNSKAAVQALKTGETVTDSFTVTTADGTTHTVSVTVAGRDDGAVIAGTDTGAVTEDTAVTTGNLQASGLLTVSDADTGEAHFTAQTDVAGSTGYGHFSLDSAGAWTYTADNSQTAIQHLKSGESLTDTLTVNSADGTTHTITVTLQGTNDAPVLAAQTQAVSEDGTQLSGHMVATDVDAGDTQTFSLANAVDGFTLNADGSYSFDPGHASYQHLAAGQTQDVVIPITVTDGAGAMATQNLTIRLTGTNDAARISGTDIGRAVEDQTLSVSGQLAISDADDGQAHFIAQTATAGSYGSLTLSEDGHWQYQLDNSKPEVQALKSTETATDTFTVHSADGSSHGITITIQGQRDNVVIGGVDVGVVKEDVSAVTGGHLVATGESAEFVPLQQRTTLGDFSMDADGAWTYTLDNSRIGTQALKAGETATETVTITHTDGSTHSITISVMGTNDAPVLSAQTQAVTEDGTQLTGHLVATDADHGDTQTFSHANTVDGFTLNADGSYSFDPSHASYQHLAAGQTQDLVIPITVTDSTGLSSTQNLTITLTGSNDGTTIAGTDSGAVTEDSHITSGKISTSGTLTVIDPDAGQDHFNALISNGHYGVFTLDAAGQWTYSADNSKPEIQHLKAGGTLTDSFTVTSADGTAHTVTVTVAGTNDAPVLAAQTQAVTEDGAQLQGHMVATDVDASDTQVFSTAQVIDGFTLNADGSYSFDPANAAYQHLATGQTQNLVIPITVTDSAGATSTQNLTITITGANDGAVISGVATGTVTEDLTLSISGQLAITDADDGQAHFVAQTATAGSYGSLTLAEDGHWSYQLDNSKPEVQALKSTETATDTFMVHSADGSSHSITVTIQGQHDSVVIGGVDVGVVKEDVSPLTGGHLVATGESAEFVPVSSLRTTLGEFSMDADGAWSYTLDNSATSAQALKDGETTTDNVSITHTDGTTHTITITVMGTNDAPVLAAQTQAVTEDGSQLSGHLVATDADAGDTKAFSMANAVDGFTLNADGSYSFDPGHASYQQLAAGHMQDVVIPIMVTDSTGLSSTQNLTITITGANDGAVIAGHDYMELIEDIRVQPGNLLAVSGDLTITDPDAGEDHFIAQTDVVGSGGFGHFSISADGQWHYSADNGQSAVQGLKPGDPHLIDTLVVTSADGTTHTLTVSIQGMNDAPLLVAQVQAETEDGTQLTGHMVATDADHGDTLTFSIANAVDGFTFNADGSYSFDPTHASYQHLAAGQTQDLVIPITVTDSTGLSSTQNLTITVTGANDGPQVTHATAATAADLGAINEDAPRVFTEAELLQAVGATDVDDGSSLHIVAGSLISLHGTFSGDAAHGFTFTPAANFSGQDVDLQFNVTDGTVSREVHGQLDVMPVADAPDRVAGKPLDSNFEDAAGSAGWQTSAGGSLPLSGGSPTGGQALALTVGGANHLHQDFDTFAGQRLHLSFDEAGTRGGRFPFEVLWEGKVVATLSPNSAYWTATHHEFDLVATGSNARLEFRSVDGIRGFDGHTDLFDNIKLTFLDASSDREALTNHDLQLQLGREFRLTDTDGSETLSYLVKGLPVGFTLTDGTHSVTVGSAGQVLETAGWNQGALAVKAPTDFVGTLEIQVSARSEETANQQTATSADIPLRLSFEHLSTPEDTPQTFSEAKLLALADLHAPAGQSYTLSDVQVDPAFGHFTHEANGSWTFTPAANVNADAVPFTLTVSGGAQPISSTLELAITPVNDAPVLAAQTQAVTEDAALFSGHVLATDPDAGDTQAFSTTATVDGFTLNADGSYQFDPTHASYQHLAAGQTQDIVIPVTVTDHAGATSTHNLTITITGANDGPQVVHATAATAADLGAINEDAPRVFTEAELLQAVGATDADDGSSLHIVAGSLTSAHGTFTGDAAHGFTFTPAANFSGQDVDLQFSVTDGTVVREAHAQLDVTPVADVPVVDLDGVHSGPFKLGWEETPKYTQDIATYAGQTLVLDLAMTNVNQSEYTLGDLEVVWNGQVIATIDRSQHGQAFSYTVTASGESSQLELRAAHPLPEDYHAMWIGLEWIEKVGVTPVHAVAAGHDLSLSSLSPLHNAHLADTDGSETLSYLVKGLPVGFTLTDGTHSVTVGSAGQVIETAGWNQDALAVKAPTDFVGTLEIQVSARSEEAANQQTATLADMPLRLSFEHLSTPEDTPKTFTESQLLQLAGIHAPAGQAYMLSDVQVDPAFGHFTHDASGSWTFIPAANVNADAVPFTLTVSGGAQPITSQLQLAIMPVNDAPLVAHGTAAAAADVGAMTGGTVRVFTEAELLQAVGASDVDDASSLHIVAGSLTSPHGTFTGDTAQGFTFTPAANYSGQDVDLQFRVTDGTASTEAHAQVDVTAVLHAPTVLGLSAVHTDFDSQAVASAGYENVDPARWGWKTDLASGVELGADRLYGAAGSSGNQIVELIADPSQPGNLFRDIATAPGEPLRFAFDLSARPGRPGAAVEVLWEGKVIDTITPGSTGFDLSRHSYDLVATGSQARLELRTQAEDPQHMVLVDNLDLASQRATSINHDLQLNLASNFRLSDTNLPGETLSLLVKGLPVGFVLTDGVHTAAVTSAGQVIDTQGWAVADLAVRAPIDYSGNLQIQVSARADDAASHQSAVSVEHLLDLSFERITVAEDTPQTFSAARLLALAGLSAPVGKTYAVDDVQIDPAFGHFTHEANGSWTFTPAANVSDDLIPFKLTVTSGSGLSVHGTLYMTITSVNDAPVLVAQHQAVDAGSSKISGRMQATDEDTGDTQAFSVAHAVDGFTLHADGSYSFDPSHATYQHIAGGQKQDVVIPITVTDHDGATSTQNLTISVTGVGHAASIGGVMRGDVTEDVNVQGGLLSTSGQLTIRDADTGEDHFIAQNNVQGNGGLGRFSVDASGHWTYTIRNDWPDVDKLGHNQMMSDTLTVRSADGTSRDITVLIHGSDDTAAFVSQGPTVSNDAYTQIAQALQSRHAVSGFQYLADMMLHQRDPTPFNTAVIAIQHAGVALLGPDGSVAHTYAAVRDVAKVPVAELIAWHAKGAGYQVVLIDATAPQVQVYAHNQGNPGMLMGRYPYTDMLLHPDLNAASFTPQMHVAAIAPTAGSLSATHVALPFDTAHVQEDNDQQIMGLLLVQDPDQGQSSMQAMTNHQAAHGSFSIDVNGNWAYQLDTSRPDVQALKDGETLIETITVHSADGTPHEVNITIHGQNDGAVITGADTGQVLEDQNVSAAGTIEAHGQLTVTDADAGEAAFVAHNAVATQFGHISIDASAAWRYEVDNNKVEVQALKAGESLTEHLTVSSVDGTTHVLTVTVQGSNDAPVLQAKSQSVTEDGSLLRGQMVAQDGDHGDALRFTTHAAVGGFALNADGSYSFDPSHHDYQGLTAGQLRDIDIPIIVTDSAEASSIQMLSLHISGKDDRAFIYGVDSGNVQASVHPQTSGDLHASDDDAGQSGFQAGTVNGSFGSLSIDAQGHWTYQVDGHDSFVLHLLPSSHITEQVTVHSVDGTAHDIEIEVSGPPGGGQLSAPVDCVNVRHVALPQVWDAYQAQTGTSPGGHEVFAGILAAVRAGGYQYQGLADELDKGSLAAVGNMDLSITGVHVQVVDKFGHLVQSISPTAENAATLHMSDVLLWHAQGHSILANSDSGFDSTRMWLHNTSDMHNIQVILPNGTGFNGWVGEYSLGELSLSPAIAYPAPPAINEQDDEPIQIVNFNEVIQNEDGMQSMTAVGVNVSDEAVTGNNDRPLPLNTATGDIGNLSELSLSSSHGTPLTTTDVHFAAQALPVDHYLQMLGLSPTTVNLSPSVPMELLPTLSSSDHFNDIDAPMHAIPEVNHFENPFLDHEKEQHKDRHFDLFDVTELHSNPNDDDLLHSALNDMHNQM